MRRLLFTIPDNIASDLQELIPAGERSRFIVQHIEIPLKELQKKGKKKKVSSIYKPGFLKGLRKAEKQARRGEVYSEKEIMKEFGLL
ncbi:MAG: hypothetical protein AAB588_01500 [Patescibacteria group bacterium]